jgi:hypothetical protein
MKESQMDAYLESLLKKANTVVLTNDEQEKQLVLMAAANGNLSDERITVATVEAARTIMLAAGEGKQDK